MSLALPPRPLRLSPLATDAPVQPYSFSGTLTSQTPPHQGANLALIGNATPNQHVQTLHQYASTPSQAYVNLSSPMSQFSHASNRFHGGAISTSNVSYNNYGTTGSAHGQSIIRRDHQSEQSAGMGYQRTVNESVVSGQSTVVAGSVVGERVTEHRIRVPKRIIREDLYEKIIVVPERRLEEEIVETEEIVREKIVEIAKPVIQEKYVDVIEVEYRDKIVEVPEVRIEERITRVPRVEMVERVQRVPKIIHQEKVVEVPHTEYREVPVVKRVEVPQIQEQIVVKERPVTVYVDKPVPEYIDVPKPYDVRIKVPVPVAAEMVCDYEVPQLEQVVKKVPYNIFLPKFVQVPVPRAMVDEFWAGQATKISNHVALLTDPNSPMSLAEVEKIAADIHNQNPVGQLRDHLEREGLTNIAARYTQGGFEVQREHDFVSSPIFARNETTAEMKGFEVQYRGGRTEKRSRGRAAGNGKSRRRRSSSHEPRSLWERFCPEWLLQAGAGSRRHAGCDGGHEKRSPRTRTKAASKPVSFGGGYPSLRAAENRRPQSRRYSSDSYSSDTSYCTSCSECNAQMQIIESSVASRRR